MTSRAASSTSAMMSDTRARRSCWRARIVTPGALQAVARSSASPGEVRRRRRVLRLHQRIETFDAGLDAAERHLPRPLELSRDQAVVRVAGGVAPFRQRGVVSRLLEVELRHPPSLGFALFVHALGFPRRLDRHGFYHAQELGRDGGVDAGAAEGHAAVEPPRDLSTFAAVRGAAGRPPGVGDGDRSSTAAAGQDAGEQRPAAAAGLRAAGPAVGVGRERLLVPLELGPADVAVVMVADQHVPGRARPAVAVGLARSPLDHDHPLLAFAVDVGAGIKRVLQDRDHVAIADRRPLEAGHPPAVRRPRERDAVGGERQQRLARAAQLAEALEDQPYRLLETQVGVEAEAMLTVPEVADRHADAELAALRLGARRIEHPRAQDPKFEFADAALHAEQEAVVRSTRVVHAVEVYHSGLDEAAEFQQVMPVATVAGETGRIEAEHRADLAGTERRHQPLEARARHHPARGPAEVVVDHLDGAEPLASGDLDQFILASPALEIGLHLGLAGLPDVDHRLPVEDRGGEHLRTRHRRLPAPRPRPAGSPGPSPRPVAPRRTCREASGSRTSSSAGAAAPAPWDRSSCSSLATIESPGELRRIPRRLSRS